MAQASKEFDFELFFDDHPTPMWVVSHVDFAVKQINQSACHMLRAERNQLIDRSFGELFLNRQQCEDLINPSLTGYQDGGILIAHTATKETLLVRLKAKSIFYRNETCCLLVGEDVSFSAQAEQIAHDFHQAIIKSSIVSRANPQGIITYVNENFERISGYSEQELIGQNHRIINSEFHSKEFWIKMWKTISAGKIWREDVKNKAKDGSYYWVDTFVMPFVDQEGRVKEFLSIRNDITKRKSQEEEIIELNHSLIDFQNAITGASIVSKADNTGRITYVNSNFVRISGYSAEELLGCNHRKINSGYHAKEFWIGMWKTITQGKMWHAEVKNRAKDGNFYWVDTFIYPLRDQHGEVVEYLSIRNDITQRKLQGDQLQQNDNQLRKLTRRLNLALGVSGLGVWKIDLKNRSLIGNERIREIYGIDSDIITFEKLWSLVHPEDRERKMMADELQFQNDNIDFISDYRIVRPLDGEIRYIKSRGIFFKEDNGYRSEGVSIIDDQTIDKKYEESLLNSLKEKEMLVKEIHHRVKNNLQLISSMFYMRTLTTGDSLQKEFIMTMREKIRSVSLVHERLLQTNGLHTINIQDYVMKLVNDIAITYHNPRLPIALETKIEKHFLSTDVTTYLGQLINELVMNAIKHAFVDRKEGTIRVSLQKDKRKFLLVVEDNGIGLKSEIDPILSNSYGMQLIHVFVNQLGGILEIKRGGGTRFEIRFSEKGNNP